MWSYLLGDAGSSREPHPNCCQRPRPRADASPAGRIHRMTRRRPLMLALRDAGKLMGPAIVPLLFSAWAAHAIYAQYHRLTAFAPVQAVIQSERIEVREETGVRGQQFTLHVPVISYRYDVDGRTYHSTRFHAYLEGGSSDWAAQAIAAHAPGQTVQAQYDPADPGEAYLRGEYHFEPYAMFLIGVASLAVFASIPAALMRRVSPGAILWGGAAAFAACVAMAHYVWFANGSGVMAIAVGTAGCAIAFAATWLSLRRAA